VQSLIHAGIVRLRREWSERRNHAGWI